MAVPSIKDKFLPKGESNRASRILYWRYSRRMFLLKGFKIAAVLESKDDMPVSCLRFKDAQGEQKYAVDMDADFDYSDEKIL